MSTIEAEYRRPEATPEALEVHREILPLATELSVLNMEPSAGLDKYYGPGGVRKIPLVLFPPDMVPGVMIFNRDEGDQRVGSYKIHGAMAALYQALREDPELERVITYSAGNHALGVIAAAKAYNLPYKTLIKTFSNISPAKEEQILKLGGELDKSYPDLEAARDAARAASNEQPHTALIEPFDAAATMAGQSTMLSESIVVLFQAHEDGVIDIRHDPITFMVPAGGGGAAAGMASMLYELKPRGVVGDNVKLKVVQMEGCDAIACAIDGRKLGELDTSCDGTAVREPGEKTMAIIKDRAFVEEVVVVPKAYVGKAMLLLEEQLGHPVEPAGALTLAAILYEQDQQTVEPPARKPIYVNLTSGRNVSEETRTDFMETASKQGLITFKDISGAYGKRREYGIDEVLSQRRSGVASAIGRATTRTVSGATAFL